MLLWVLWKNRNNSVWEAVKESGQVLGAKTLCLWQEWATMQRTSSSNFQPAETSQQIIQWQRPHSGWFKCNVDAGFHNDLNKTSVGWCLRDHAGQFVKAGSCWNQGKCSIIEGEAIALLQAMKEMEQGGFTHVIFETDSKNVIDAVHKFRIGNSEFSSLICNINNVMSLNPNFVVKFIKRQANMVAHTLARAAISWPRRYIFDLLPPCIGV
ncbi:hypothetical protein TSUD_425140, partial [Trifolium subterraneum]